MLRFQGLGVDFLFGFARRWLIERVDPKREVSFNTEVCEIMVRDIAPGAAYHTGGDPWAVSKGKHSNSGQPFLRACSHQAHWAYRILWQNIEKPGLGPKLKDR